MPEILKTVHNHIPTFWSELSGASWGQLTFRVGSMDEPAHLSGITHLLEHLIFRVLGSSPDRHGGVVDGSSISFYASAQTPDDVAAYLNGIARAISAIDTITDEDVTREKNIVAIEIQHNFFRPTSGLLTYRYGLPGIGTTNFGAPTTGSLTRSEIVAWCTRWLTADNAVLAINSGLPSTLDIKLPQGPSPRKPMGPQVVQTPLIVESTKSSIALSLLVANGWGSMLIDALKWELSQRLREDLGLLYSPDEFTTHVDASHSEIVLVLDTPAHDVAEALTESMAVIRRTLENGFSPEAFRFAYNEGMVSLLNPFVPRDELEIAATNQLLERNATSPSGYADFLRGATIEDLSNAFRRSYDSLIVAYDEDVHLSKKQRKSLNIPVDRYFIWERSDAIVALGRSTRPTTTWRSKENDFSIFWTDTHLISKGVEEYEYDAIAISNVVLVGDRKCGCVVLVDNRGRSLEITPDDFKKFKSLRKETLAKFRPEIIRTFPAH